MAAEHKKKRKQQAMQEAGDRQPAAQQTASGKKQKRRAQDDQGGSDAAGTSGREHLQPQQVQAAGNGQHAAPKNKEKVLVLCTRGVTFRWVGCFAWAAIHAARWHRTAERALISSPSPPSTLCK